VDISLMREARSRSVSAENLTGEPGRGGMAASGTGQGAARDLGIGWNCRALTRDELEVDSLP
jgi:hypothetical protein